MALTAEGMALLVEHERMVVDIRAITGCSEYLIDSLVTRANVLSRDDPNVAPGDVMRAALALARQGLDVPDICEQVEHCLAIAHSFDLRLDDAALRVRNDLVFRREIPDPRPRVLTWQESFFSNLGFSLDTPGTWGTLILRRDCPDYVRVGFRQNPMWERGHYNILTVEANLVDVDFDDGVRVPLNAAYVCSNGQEFRFVCGWAPNLERGTAAPERPFLRAGQDCDDITVTIGGETLSDIWARLGREPADTIAMPPRFRGTVGFVDERAAPSATVNESGDTLLCVFCDKPGRIRAEGFAPECNVCAGQWED